MGDGAAGLESGDHGHNLLSQEEDRLNHVGIGHAGTGQRGFVAVFEQFSGFMFFLLPSIVHAHLAASNASRSAGSQPSYMFRSEGHAARKLGSYFAASAYDAL